VLSMRGGKDHEGFVCHGYRTMTFKTVFGTVPVTRHRYVHTADRSSEIPAGFGKGGFGKGDSLEKVEKGTSLIVVGKGDITD
jgi:hypothetical protein